MHRSIRNPEEDSTTSTVSVRCFTLKKWTLSLCILVELVEAVIAIVTEAVHYSKSEHYQHQNQLEESHLVALVLWSLVFLVRLIFLYGVIWERFWLCLAYAVISFGHIVILATTGDQPNWLWVLFTTLLTIVSLLYVMDQFLIRQEQSEKEQRLAEEHRQHVQQVQTFNNNNNNNNITTDIKYIGTLV